MPCSRTKSSKEVVAAAKEAKERSRSDSARETIFSKLLGALYKSLFPRGTILSGIEAQVIVRKPADFLVIKPV